MEIDPNGLKGYFLVGDLEYTAYIHDKTADLPFAPESMTMMEKMLTPHMKTRWHIINAQQGKDANHKFQGTIFICVMV